jgi:hypothetical protein
MTVSKQFLEKLEAARKGQGHEQPGASAEKVLEAALDLLLAAQAKRRAEVDKPQQNPRPARNPCHDPAAVKRAVWARDEGKCWWRLDSGGICGSTMCLEIDHIRPLARGASRRSRIVAWHADSTTSSPHARSTATTGWTGSSAAREGTSRSRGKPWRPGPGRACEGLRAVLETHAFPTLRRHSSAGRATDS